LVEPTAELSSRQYTVAIAIPTFKRVPQLTHLLQELDQLDNSSVAPLFAVGVLVVDNDPQQSAWALCADRPGVRYVSEPRPGIAAARNRAMEEAGTDLLVFIDDDERPDKAWLAALLAAWSVSGSAAVAGRVVAVFQDALDPWLEAGDFWERPSMPTGTCVPVAASGNLLLDLRQIHLRGVRFDERFALGGGEDVAFTRDLVRAGGRITWCDESIAYDPVPAQRATRRWIFERAWSQGSIRAAVDLRERAGWRATPARVAMAGRGAVRVVAGLARAAMGFALSSPRHQGRGLCTALRGAGMVAGSAGHLHQEYAARRASTAPLNEQDGR
jgi:GT2 family glycosyltransferase